MWNHDDDQGVGVLAAINQAGRKEFIMVGGAGSANALREIKAEGKGLSDLVEKQVPNSITLASETITKDNVDQYMSLGFES